MQDSGGCAREAIPRCHVRAWAVTCGPVGHVGMSVERRDGGPGLKNASVGRGADSRPTTATLAYSATELAVASTAAALSARRTTVGRSLLRATGALHFRLPEETAGARVQHLDRYVRVARP